jgi:hypothetical protein
MLATMREDARSSTLISPVFVDPKYTRRPSGEKATPM